MAIVICNGGIVSTKIPQKNDIIIKGNLSYVFYPKLNNFEFKKLR